MSLSTTLNAGLHVHDYDTVDQYVIKDEDGNVVNLSGKSLVLYYRRPDGTLLTKTPTLTTDGTDGLLQYTFVSGDLAQAGWWNVQAKIDNWRTDLPQFRVLENIG